MKWIKFSDQYPTLSGDVRDPATTSEEMVIRTPRLGERRAKWQMGGWLLSDCTHPLQNCYFNTADAEWLED